jgi:hypothetical protein
LLGIHGAGRFAHGDALEGFLLDVEDQRELGPCAGLDGTVFEFEVGVLVVSTGASLARRALTRASATGASF